MMNGRRTNKPPIFCNRELRLICNTKNRGPIALEAWPNSSKAKACSYNVGKHSQDQIWKLLPFDNPKFACLAFHIVCETLNKGRVHLQLEHKKDGYEVEVVPSSQTDITSSKSVWFIESSGLNDGCYRIFNYMMDPRLLTNKLYLEAWPKDESIRIGEYKASDQDQIWQFHFQDSEHQHKF